MKDLANFGDSVHWGQGHLPNHKFARTVADALGLQLRMKAHSGATIGVDADCNKSANEEVPYACPTILEQVQNYSYDSDAAGLVLVNGGVNDVGVQNIINPVVTPEQIRLVTRKFCHKDMTRLLAEVLRRFAAPRTRIIVTSYFPIFSRSSDFTKIQEYLVGNLIAVPREPELAAQRRSILDRVVENSQRFWKESTASLREAIRDVGSSRIQFAYIPFGDDNAMFASAAWLWEVHLHGGKLVPEDPVASQRHKACDDFHPLPLDRETCYIASAGHPNLKGSKAFADTILAVASQ